MRAVLVLAFAFLALPAEAMTDHGLLMPPARYDHAPTVATEILRVPDPNRQCRLSGKAHVDGLIVGCAIPAKGGEPCLIVVGEHPVIPLSVILRHEYGHCNGWSPDHPG